MNPSSVSDITAELLLFSLFSVLAIGLVFVLVIGRVLARQRRRAQARAAAAREKPHAKFLSTVFSDPPRWLVVRSSNPAAAQMALDLHNARRCSWGEGLSKLGDHTLFISPPLEGWLLVVGPGLPDPADDVDECYRFILKLSRELGHAQFFCANRALSHYGWVKAEGDQIIRGYAWAGETVWNQGRPSLAERELGLRALEYGEVIEDTMLAREVHQGHVEKVLQLAARWSFDPTQLDGDRLAAGQGISGEVAHHH